MISKNRIGIFLIAIGIGLRILILSNCQEFPDYSQTPYTDEIHYHQLAENLIKFKEYAAVTGGFFNTSIRPPTYPVFSSVFSFLSNHSYHAHHFFNFVFDLVNLFLIFLLGSLLYGSRCGIWATVVYGFFGPAFVYLKFGTSEILVVSLILSSIIYLYCLQQIGGLHYVIAAGFCYALLIHARPAFMLILPVIFVFSRYRSSRSIFIGSLKNCALTIFLVAILMIPWLYRNYKHHGNIIPVCTVAGWHLSAHVRSLSELPVELMWRYVYDPKRRGYTEGDYYNEATRDSIKLARDTPIKSTLIGLIRIGYAWGFAKPYFRILNPKSYVYPIYLNDKSFVPLLDFEGLFYLGVLIVLSLVIFNKRFIKKRYKKWFFGSKSIIILLLAYILVHTISIPMIQYRFVIEPMIIILIIGLIFHLSGIENPPEDFEVWQQRSLFIPATIFIIMSISFSSLYMFAYGTEKYRKTVDYSLITCHQDHASGYLNYRDIREIQWQDYGMLSSRQFVTTMGEVKYLVKNRKFISSQISAIQSRGSVAKLFVRKYDPENFLGMGDLKLNFKHDPKSLKDGDIICVSGIAETDPFREIIIHVEHFEIVK